MPQIHNLKWQLDVGGSHKYIKIQITQYYNAYYAHTLYTIHYIQRPELQAAHLIQCVSFKDQNGAVGRSAVDKTAATAYRKPSFP